MNQDADLRENNRGEDSEYHPTNRYWVSWWSGYYADEGCTNPPFQFWNSGERDRANGDRTDCSLCAVIDALSPDDVFSAIKRHFPDMEVRFCNWKPSDFVPGDRFPNFESRTLIDQA